MDDHVHCCTGFGVLHFHMVHCHQQDPASQPEILGSKYEKLSDRVFCKIEVVCQANLLISETIGPNLLISRDMTKKLAKQLTM